MCVAPGEPAPTQPVESEPVKSEPAKPVSDEAALCRKACERTMACEAEAQGIAEPEGQGREKQLNRCGKLCEFVTNDYNRGQLRKCLTAESCETFNRCMNPPDATL